MDNKRKKLQLTGLLFLFLMAVFSFIEVLGWGGFIKLPPYFSINDNIAFFITVLAVLGLLSIIFLRYGTTKNPN